ncbi:Uncharacterised protein [uncultured archaeon]|nr:Uncharacterised protein [uncultured archaeon]
MEYAAIDSHKESVQVHRIDGNARPVLRERYPTTLEGLEQCLEHIDYLNRMLYQVNKQIEKKLLEILMRCS